MIEVVPTMSTDSEETPRRAGGYMFTRFTVRFLATLFVSSLVSFSLQAAMSISASKMTITKNDQNQEINFISFMGGIEEADVTTLANLLASESVDKNLGTLFFVASPGGYLDTAPAMIKVLKTFQAQQKAKGKFVAAYVGKDNECASLCTLVFMHFKNRFVAAESKFGYHAPHFFGLYMPDETKELIKMYNEAANQQKNIRFSKWLVKNAGIFEEVDISWFDGNRLVKENSGIATNNQPLSMEELTVYLGAL